MYLKSFKLVNFRKFGTENNVIEFVDSVDGVQSDKVDISKSTTLIVGKNNSGKTTITKAFEKLIGKSKFEASDFNFCYLAEFLDKYMEDSFEQFPVIEF
ncbi:ATP-binding protein [Candidatus Gracilibacteria bacterium]|nr:ATP-binding protein [Candidatus Gracilibacteria bacterium]